MGKNQKHSLLSLYTGAGGLDIGLEAAGFLNRICVEIDKDARKTLQANRPYWKLARPYDIHEIAPKDLLKQSGLSQGEVTLLAGGTPCQPFSKSAYWSNNTMRGLLDPRAKTLQAYLDVVDAALPKVFLLENVQGLAFNGKDEGLKLLRHRIRGINLRHKTNYEIQVIPINAASYGVPQFRERVFIIASIDGKKLYIPPVTHGDAEGLTPYCTAWDAIGDLDSGVWAPELNPTGKWADLLKSIPEGLNYLWHTPRGNGEPLFGWRTRYWSFLLKLAKNLPSWTIQADPGPATGPFHWKSRLLSIEEMARLQTFPENYTIKGDRRSGRRQIGNAVPCAIGEFLGLEIRRQFFGERVRRALRLIPLPRTDCPPPERSARVPMKYLDRRGQHPDHPGIGLGPAARHRDHIETGA